MDTFELIDKDKPFHYVATLFKVDRATLWRHLRREERKGNYIENAKGEIYTQRMMAGRHPRSLRPNGPIWCSVT